MAGTRIQPTTEGGGRKATEETKTKLRAAGQSAWGALTDEQRAARLANLAKGRASRSGPPPVDPPPAPATGGPRSPLVDAPGAPRDHRPSSQGRLNGHTNGHAAPPRFVVPDMPPLELGGNDEAGGAVSAAIDGPAVGNVALSQAQVESLLGFPFELIGLRRGRHWKLRDDEKAMVAEPLTRKLNEHAAAARVIGAGGDWVVIVGGIALLVSARLMEDSARAGSTAPAVARPDDGSRSSRGAPPPDDGLGDVDPGPRAGGPGGGTINGFSVGETPGGGPEAAPAAAPSAPLVQAL